MAPGTFHHPESGGKNKQDPQGWYGEETLDVESVHGMAPAANIVYVGAPNNFQDLDAALNNVVDRHLAQIVTNSYGFPTEVLPPGFIKPYQQTILQGAVEGIGIYFSSGDNSDESLTVGYRTADWPASSPFVTAVGGTHVCLRKVEPKSVFDLINKESISVLCAAPTVLIGVANAPHEMRKGCRCCREHHRHLTADYICQCRRCAFIRNMYDIDAGSTLK